MEVMGLLASLVAFGALMATPYGEDTAAALTECGVLRSEVKIEWADDFQDDIVTIATPDERIPEIRLDCLVSAIDRHPAVYEFASAELGTRYQAAYEASPEARAAAMQMREEARNGLAKKGLLERAPRYDPAAETLSAFLERVEVFAGFEPNSILTVVGDLVAVRPKGSEQQPPFDGFSTLMKVLTLGLPEEGGPRIVLIGEDAAQD